MKPKPLGKWKCRACGHIWEGWQLYLDPSLWQNTWTCADLLCGGVCDPLNPVRVTDDTETEE